MRRTAWLCVVMMTASFGLVGEPASAHWNTCTAENGGTCEFHCHAQEMVWVNATKTDPANPDVVGGSGSCGGLSGSCMTRSFCSAPYLATFSDDTGQCRSTLGARVTCEAGY